MSEGEGRAGKKSPRGGWLGGTVRALLHAVWGVAATLIIAVAVIITSARLVLDNAEGYRDAVTAAVGDYLGLQVEVASMDATVDGVRPTLVLEGVRLNTPGGDSLATFDELHLALSPLRSLRDGQPVLGELTLSGADLGLVRDSEGRLRAAGMALAEEGGGEGDGALLPWFFRQARLTVRDSDLTWVDRQHGDGRPHRFHADELTLTNRFGRHQLAGQLSLPGPAAGRLSLAADLYGVAARPGDWEGRVFLRAEGISLDGLADAGVDTAGVGGTADAMLWSRWRQGRAVAVDGQIRLDELRREGAMLPLAALEVDLDWERRADGWRLTIPRLDLHGTGERESTARLRATATEGGRLAVDAAGLAAGDLAAVLQSWPDAPKEVRRRVTAAEPRGRVERLHLRYRPQAVAEERWSLHARLAGWTNQPVEQLPGVAGLDAEVWVDPAGGVARLAMGSGQLAFPVFARKPWPVDAASVRVDWQRAGDGWRFQFREGRVENAHVAARGEARLHWPGPGEPVFVDLQVGADRADAAHLSRYLPVEKMKPKLVDWLDRGVVGGTARDVRILLFGRVEKGVFPWPRDRRGRLFADLAVADAELAYGPGWPRLERIDGRLTIRGRGLSGKATGRTATGAVLDGARFAIEDFRNARVTLESPVSGEAGAFLDYLHRSPLVPGAEPLLDRARATGPMTLDLALDLPLDGSPPDYTGELTAEDVDLGLTVGEGELTWRGITGPITFTPRGLESPGLTGELLDGPAELAITSSGERGAIRSHVTAKGRAAVAPLEALWPAWPLERAAGRARWTLNATHDADGWRVHGHSPLRDVGLDLPHPLGKARGVARATEVRWEHADSEWRFLQAGGLAARARFGEGRGAVHFGAREVAPPLPQRGVRVTGALEGLDTAAWRARLPEFGERDGGGIQRLELDMERLHLAGGDGLPRGEPPEPGSGARGWPELEVAIGELRLGDMALGQVEVVAGPTATGWATRTLQLRGDDFRGDGVLAWERQSGRTGLELSLRSEDSGAFFGALGYRTIFADGELRSSFDLHWPGGPQDFHPATLEGQARTRIRDGRLVQVEAGAGRLLGLFSLQALPRRLTLDFSDLFSRGFSFDKLDSRVTLSGGIAAIDKMTLEAPSARIAVTGETDLVARELDQRILVVPGDGSTLALPSALLWGPQTGALVWLAERVLPIDDVTRYVYRVTGSWEDPEIRRLDEEEE
ncbi:TIGR02099 family protein [Thiohalospira halophila DSM 15071]|uniref:TIGR02099 family protein n=1 Tax=Thiohalospira halophila DSM 15071 TaxID=1123397 RepID=A0A1I1QVV3_9GAMM|nr:AsmA-like C-terminal region-containing protein [Thiohalospira halophila]SFD26122.1 TIGR02099 family protein [Thiohalospira halophila DSM 15071]